MGFRWIVLGLILLAPGCGGEPERSRVVPAEGPSDDSKGRVERPAPGAVRKIEMH